MEVVIHVALTLLGQYRPPFEAARNVTNSLPFVLAEAEDVATADETMVTAEDDATMDDVNVSEDIATAEDVATMDEMHAPTSSSIPPSSSTQTQGAEEELDKASTCEDNKSVDDRFPPLLMALPGECSGTDVGLFPQEPRTAIPATNRTVG